MSEEEDGGLMDDEKVDKAVEILKDAGLTDMIIVGRGVGRRLIVKEFHEDADFQDVSEIQGYLAQAQTNLSAMQLETSSERKGEEVQESE